MDVVPGPAFRLARLVDDPFELDVVARLAGADGLPLARFQVVADVVRVVFDLRRREPLSGTQTQAWDAESNGRTVVPSAADFGRPRGCRAKTARASGAAD